MILHNMVSDGQGGSNLTVFINGQMHVADSQHPNFATIVNKVIAGDESVVDNFDLQSTVTKRFERLSDRVSIRNGVVYFDGDPQDNAVTKQIVRCVEEDADFQPLVVFMENVAQNPNPHSRENLYRWLQAHNYSLTPEGNFIGYKGVEAGTAKDSNEVVYYSVHSGRAIVDGVEVNGKIPNRVGSIIEMPRSEVQFDPGQGCSTGLHVGTWSYAQSFAGTVLECHVNPRDVVSVPTDSGDQKLRTCRYEVVAKLDKEYDSAVVGGTYGDNAYDDYDDEEYDDDEEVYANTSVWY